jgi:hypothetical protein
MSSPAVAPAVAAALARFHAVPVPGDKSAGAHPPATPFARTREWLAVARGLDFSDDPVKLSAFRAFDFDRLAAEVGAVEAAAAAACSPTVFAHNDLLSGNIMVPPDFPCAGGGGGGGGGGAENGGAHAGQQAAAAGMTFIDFEYAGWAPRGFDWGNHFCEYAGFEGDYSRYPGPEAAARFVRAYLAAAGGVAEAQVVRPPPQPLPLLDFLLFGPDSAAAEQPCTLRACASPAPQPPSWPLIDLDPAAPALRAPAAGGRRRGGGGGGGKRLCAGVPPVLGRLGHHAGAVVGHRLRLHGLRRAAVERVLAAAGRVSGGGGGRGGGGGGRSGGAEVKRARSCKALGRRRMR